MFRRFSGKSGKDSERQRTDNDSDVDVDNLMASADPRTYQSGSSGVLRVGPRPEVAPVPDTPADWIQTGVWTSWEPPLRAVAGEAHYRDILDARIGQDADGLVPVAVDLVRDPGNDDDTNVVGIEFDHDLVGYVRKDLAAVIAGTLDDAACPRLRVPAVIYADADNDARHIWLWLRRRLSEGPPLPIPIEFADANEAALQEDDGKSFPPGDPVIDRFYELNSDAELAWSERDCERAVDTCKEVFAILGAFLAAHAAEELEQRHQVQELLTQPGLPDDLREQLSASAERNPPIHRISALSVSGPIMAAMGDRDGLTAMRGSLISNSLEECVAEIDGYLAAEELTARLVEFVSANPGTLQKELFVQLDADKERVLFACYMLATVGRMERTKQGTSYGLTIR